MSVMVIERSVFMRIIRRYFLARVNDSVTSTVVWNSVRSVGLLECLVSESVSKNVDVNCFCHDNLAATVVNAIGMKYGAMLRSYQYILWPYSSNIEVVVHVGEDKLIDDYFMYYLDTLNQFFPSLQRLQTVTVRCKCHDGRLWYSGNCAMAIMDCFFDEYLYWEPIKAASLLSGGYPMVIIGIGFLTKGVRNLEYLIQELVKNGYDYGITFPYQVYDGSGIYVRYLLAAVNTRNMKGAVYEP